MKLRVKESFSDWSIGRMNSCPEVFLARRMPQLIVSGFYSKMQDRDPLPLTSLGLPIPWTIKGEASDH
jgi:hypothetical protein